MQIFAKIKIKAKENSIKEITPGHYEIRVSIPPEKGKANQKAITLLANHLGIAPGRISILAGATSRNKVFSVE
jgi:uncharacterized protein YggU (UPF0235/DUF167 family)